MVSVYRVKGFSIPFSMKYVRHVNFDFLFIVRYSRLLSNMHHTDKSSFEIIHAYSIWLHYNMLFFMARPVITFTILFKKSQQYEVIFKWFKKN